MENVENVKNVENVENVENSLSMCDAILLYINTLNSIELEILDLARTELKSSFDIEKSIGFLSYLKKNNVKLLNC